MRLVELSARIVQLILVVALTATIAGAQESKCEDKIIIRQTTVSLNQTTDKLLLLSCSSGVVGQIAYERKLQISDNQLQFFYGKNGNLKV